MGIKRWEYSFHILPTNKPVASAGSSHVAASRLHMEQYVFCFRVLIDFASVTLLFSKKSGRHPDKEYDTTQLI